MVLYSVGQKKYNFSEVIDEIPMVFDSRYTPQQPFYKLPQYGFKLTEEILSRFIDFSLESDTLSGKPNRNPVSTPVESFSTSLCTLATVDAEECDDDKWSIDKLSNTSFFSQWTLVPFSLKIKKFNLVKAQKHLITSRESPPG
ncbi:hypothetical protein ACOME3_009553 [Neoechinorhynchus agilis]